MRKTSKTLNSNEAIESNEQHRREKALALAKRNLEQQSGRPVNVVWSGPDTPDVLLGQVRAALHTWASDDLKCEVPNVGRHVQTFHDRARALGIVDLAPNPTARGFMLALERRLTPSHAAGIVCPPSNAHPARTWQDPDTMDLFTFETDHQFAVWSEFASSRHPVSLSHLCDTIPRWKESNLMTGTAIAFIKTLRKWWREQGREDIAQRIKLTGETVQFLPAKR